jgi:hypothetical protein
MNPISDLVEPFALDERDAPQDGWDDPVSGRLRWRTLFSKGATPSAGMTCGVAEFRPGEWLGLNDNRLGPKQSNAIGAYPIP